MTAAIARSDGRLTMLRLCMFGVSVLPVGLVAIALAVYVPRHYAQHVGMDLTAVGGAFVLIRLFDVFSDIVLAVIIPKTRTPLGRYRVWSVIGGAVLMLGTWFLFNPTSGVGSTYLIGWLLVTYLGESIVKLTLFAWAAELAQTYNERSRIFGVLAGFDAGGAGLTISIAFALGHFRIADASIIPTLGLIAVCIVPFALGCSLLRTPEHDLPQRRDPAVRLIDIGLLLRNPTYMRILFSELLLVSAPAWMSACFLFYFTDVRGFTVAQASLLLAARIPAGIVGAPVMGLLATRFSKHRALMASAIAYGVGVWILTILPRGGIAVEFVALFILWVMASGFKMLPQAMTADAADEARLRHGRSPTMMMYAILGTTGKIASAFSIGIIFFALSKLGYTAKEGVVNTPEAIHHLGMVFLIGPIILIALAVLPLVGYQLTRSRHAEIRRKLDERESLMANEPPGPSTDRPAPATTPLAGVITERPSSL